MEEERPMETGDPAAVRGQGMAGTGRDRVAGRSSTQEMTMPGTQKWHIGVSEALP